MKFISYNRDNVHRAIAGVNKGQVVNLAMFLSSRLTSGVRQRSLTVVIHKCFAFGKIILLSQCHLSTQEHKTITTNCLRHPTKILGVASAGEGVGEGGGEGAEYSYSR